MLQFPKAHVQLKQLPAEIGDVCRAAIISPVTVPQREFLSSPGRKIKNKSWNDARTNQKPDANREAKKGSPRIRA
jgi:hypothetical protein